MSVPSILLNCPHFADYSHPDDLSLLFSRGAAWVVPFVACSARFQYYPPSLPMLLFFSVSSFHRRPIWKRIYPRVMMIWLSSILYCGSVARRMPRIYSWTKTSSRRLYSMESDETTSLLVQYYSSDIISSSLVVFYCISINGAYVDFVLVVHLFLVLHSDAVMLLRRFQNESAYLGAGTARRKSCRFL